jgi:hypothetical protein
MAANPTNPAEAGFHVLPDCDASKLINKTESTDMSSSSACGFGKFEELVVRSIKWLLYILIPIGFCIVGWAGFKIMTSAGNTEAVSQARGMIKIVVIGIVIAAVSYIVIVNIFALLGVNADIKTLK